MGHEIDTTIADLAAAQCGWNPEERASALETEIWERIKGDETGGRLAIYLENCTLCVYRDEAQAKITAALAALN